MKLTPKNLAILCLSIVFMLSSMPLSAVCAEIPVSAAQMPVISVVPSTPTVQIDESFTVDINVADVVDLYGYQFDLNYDPAILEAVSVTAGDYTSPAAFFLAGTIDNVQGTIKAITATLLGNVPGLSGNKVLAHVTFKAKSAGTSSISITNEKLSDSNAVVIQSSVVSGSVQVMPPAGTPVANAGVDQTVNENTAVTLDGSASTGENLSYLWEQTGGPGVVITGSTNAMPTFTAPAVAANTTLTFKLTVTSGALTSSDTVSVLVKNVVPQPVANAGLDQTVNENAAVTLDGSASTGENLTYAWLQEAGPTVTLTGAGTIAPTFTAPAVAADTVLTFKLTVTSGTMTSTDTVDILVKNVVPQPVANAGVDQTVDENAAVTLNGSASTGENLTYAWLQEAGPTVTLTGAGTIAPTFTAPSVGADTTLTFKLTVTSGTMTSSDTVDVIVKNVVPQPVANAGLDQNVNENTAVTLDGSVSTGENLSYLWEQTSGPGVVITGSTNAMPTFTAPAVAADTTLTFRLTVTSGAMTSTDTVDILVKDIPVVMTTVSVTPATKSVIVGDTFTLDVYVTDVADLYGTSLPVQFDPAILEAVSITEGDFLKSDGAGTSCLGGTIDNTSGNISAYACTRLTVLNGVTGSGKIATITFKAKAPGMSTVSLTGVKLSDSNAVEIPVILSSGQVTVGVGCTITADAGSDQTVDECITAILDGSASTGENITYAWTQESGPTVTLSGADQAKPTFVVPSVDADVVLTFKLTIQCGEQTLSDTVNVTVRNIPSQTGGGGGVAAPSDLTPPTLVFVSPGAGWSLTKTIAAIIEANDPAGVSKIEFYIDGQLKMTDDSAPYIYDWDTTAVSDGPHTISAAAYDTLGNIATTAVAVSVANNAAVMTTVTQSAAVTSILPTPVKQTVFQVHGGAYKKLRTARNLVKRLKRRGFNATIITQGGGRPYLIEVAVFEKQSDAKSLLKRLYKKKLRFTRMRAIERII